MAGQSGGTCLGATLGLEAREGLRGSALLRCNVEVLQAEGQQVQRPCGGEA